MNRANAAAFHESMLQEQALKQKWDENRAAEGSLAVFAFDILRSSIMFLAAENARKTACEAKRKQKAELAEQRRKKFKDKEVLKRLADGTKFSVMIKF